MIFNYIILSMLLLSFFFSALNGNLDVLGTAIKDGADEAINLSINMAGMLCLWSAIMALMAKSGLSEKISRLLKPFLGFIFKEIKEDTEAMSAISQNVSANLLGLGSAATPAGILATKRLVAISNSDYASNALCRFVVLNTASITLFPITVGSIRGSLGAQNPFDIMPAVWLTSICSVTFGLLSSKLLERRACP